MADYREVSQEYAQGAIKAALWANGGMAFAILSQLSSLSEFMGPETVATASLIGCVGVLAGLITWLLAFFSTRYVDRTIQGEEESFEVANRFMLCGVAAFACSLLCFIIAPIVILFGI
ncbi:hypothetical protein ILP92_05235 [Maribius pontilimi]|uniref:Uncharacterized protein n=1 Tax=Palleronia pontilimi TaxID=1964209 RepID=A0A934I809_9RHOB|nr:hypothetical protein [Palleronia pontilimi]MBJ3762144.1 hypothetical protein [Palleronia pontilimi]